MVFAPLPEPPAEPLKLTLQGDGDTSWQHRCSVFVFSDDSKTPYIYSKHLTFFNQDLDTSSNITSSLVHFYV